MHVHGGPRDYMHVHGGPRDKYMHVHGGPRDKYMHVHGGPRDKYMHVHGGPRDEYMHVTTRGTTRGHCSGLYISPYACVILQVCVKYVQEGAPNKVWYVAVTF